MHDELFASEGDAIVAMIGQRQFGELKEKLSAMNPADIAVIFEQIDTKDLLIIYRLLPKELAFDVFSYLEPDKQELLVNGFSDKELGEVIESLFVDDAADMLDEMPASLVNRILRNARPDTRRQINELLRYPEDSAGALMNTEYVHLDTGMTVAEALARIRREGVDKETIYTCYVTKGRTLIGVLSVKELLLASDDRVVDDLMEENVIFVEAAEDKEQVARIFSKYDFMALPVVDKERRIIGIITVDDAIDVLEEEATEDIEKMAAILPGDKPYLKTGIWETWRQRIPWLLLLMVSATFTGQIITSFEASLAVLPVLTAFIPMLMDTGGNSGGQASVTIIRSLALEDVTPGDLLSIIWKEARVAAVCGLTLSLANFVKIMLVDNLIFHSGVSLAVAMVVCLTLAVVILAAKLVGCTLPVLAKMLGFDPAVMASPFITTVVDAVALMVYFGFAKAILVL